MVALKEEKKDSSFLQGKEKVKRWNQRRWRERDKEYGIIKAKKINKFLFFWRKVDEPEKLKMNLE